MTDLSHIQRQIQKNQVSAQDLHRQAENESRAAGQSDGGGGTYHEQEAQRLNEKAAALEQENQQLLAEQSQQENHLADLQKRREALLNDHRAQLKELDREIERVRGSSLTL